MGDAPIRAAVVAVAAIVGAGVGGCRLDAIAAPDATADRGRDAMVVDAGPLFDASAARDASTLLDAGGGVDGSLATDASPSAADATACPAVDGVPGCMAQSPIPDAGSSTAAWRPALLQGLVLWLAPEGIVSVDQQAGTPVTSWLDQSPVHQDSQASTAKVACSVLGLPGVRFSNALMTFRDNWTLQFGLQDFAVFAVARDENPWLPNSDSGYGLLFDKVLQSPPYLGVTLSFNTGQTTGFAFQTSDQFVVVSSEIGCNDGRLRSWGARRRGSLLEVFLNGVSVQALAAAPVDVSARGAPLWLGGNAFGTQTMQGDLYELVVVKGTFEDADVVRLAAYFQSRYRLE
jgi:hypothetical protein